MANIETAIGSLLSISSTMLDTIVANPIFACLFATTFVSIGIGIVRKFKHN